jgi:hypothetical protein
MELFPPPANLSAPCGCGQNVKRCRQFVNKTVSMQLSVVMSVKVCAECPIWDLDTDPVMDPI